jgi:hypothetical protein
MAYKLLRERYRKDGSKFFISLTKDWIGAGVEYKVGEATKPVPGNGPLAAFKSLNDVAFFKKEYGWSYVLLFRCRIRKDMKQEKLWYKDGTGYICKKDKKYLPPGTILCKSITITKQIM